MAATLQVMISSIAKLAMLSLFAITLLLAGCNADESSDIMTFSPDDSEMNSAIQEAGRTLDTFIENLQSPKPGQRDFSIKARFAYDTDEASHEHIWIDNVAYEGGKFRGTIANDPVYVEGLKFGDAVTIDKSDVTDWMYVDNGKLVGGYTLRVMRGRLSPQEREEFDASLGFVIGE
jgi:uncharacterized protein YegJ (DUF2314 family)